MAKDTPLACALTADELPARIATARRLGERALVGVEVADRRAVLRFEGERESVEAFVEAESACCTFLTFNLADNGDQIELEILTPAGGVPVLRGLVAGVVAGWDGGLG